MVAVQKSDSLIIGDWQKCSSHRPGLGGATCRTAGLVQGKAQRRFQQPLQTSRASAPSGEELKAPSKSRMHSYT